jgi:hypothetical protein
MTDDQAKVSEAIELYLGSYLSKEDREKIIDHFGEAIAILVQEVYDSAIGCPVDWSKAGVDEGLGVMSQVLDERYPWLSYNAHMKLVHAFVMTWK